MIFKVIDFTGILLDLLIFNNFNQPSALSCAPRHSASKVALISPLGANALI